MVDGFCNTFVIGIVFQITGFMYTESSSASQSHDSCCVAENQSAVVNCFRQQGIFVNDIFVVVTVQGTEIMQCVFKSLRGKHITHVQRDCYGFACV